MSKAEYDNIINNLMNKEIKNDTIYVCNKRWGGICDQFAYGNYDSMSKYLSLYSQIPKYTSMYSYLPKAMIPNELNAERLLGYYLRENGLSVEVVDVRYDLHKNRNSETCSTKYKKSCDENLQSTVLWNI